MTFKIVTLGCKVNIYESELIKELMLQEGFRETKSLADIVIVNTCSVTNNADAKSRKLIRKNIKENEGCISVVCGCMSENHQDIYKDISIDILLGNKDKSKIVTFIKDFIKNKKQIIKFYTHDLYDFENMKVDKYDKKTRAFVKIQDGCNNYCSYCVIPYLRGNSRSKNFQDVVDEIKSLTDNNHQEIVLTGIHTGSYLHNRKTLTNLIQEISKIDKLKRIRISSIEVTEINDSFLEELKVNNKICNHLHIPLQSGSNNILRLMNRKYDLEEFEIIINKIKKIRPDINITTDVIVGFPSESEEDFIKTINFCKKIKFSKIHIFPYSVRDKTLAKTLPGHLKGDIKRQRVIDLNKVSKELEKKYYNQFLNKTIEILIEETNTNYSIGHASNYIKVKVNKSLPKNNFYKVKIVKISNDIVLGIVV